MAITFKASPSKVGALTIIKVPKSASVKLPSRGMVMVEGTINGSPFKAPLEPDGKGSHWLELDKKLLKAAGKEASFEISPTDSWIEVKVPADAKELTKHPTWQEISPGARWDWIRWIRATNNPETRQKRIKVALSKFRAGSRRPCCFNRASCTDPSVSKGGILIDA